MISTSSLLLLVAIFACLLIETEAQWGYGGYGMGGYGMYGGGFGWRRRMWGMGYPYGGYGGYGGYGWGK
ncbi:unnamed protein product [Caenorhabditis angaria]|uniref:Uncharacterized protein n=1 Tax=Caenorhabditis angaria TaxID=860376 RepID=A0A9P1ITY9_9PELO|nr:unnamed protein product [Caenorhabditis angaria]